MRITYLHCTLISVLLVIIGYWCWQNHLRERIVEDMQKCSGAADCHVRNVINDYEKLMGKSTIERFNEARLIDLNLHEGRPISKRVHLNRVADGYLARAHDEDIDMFEIDQIQNFVDRNIDNLGHGVGKHIREVTDNLRPKKVHIELEKIKKEKDNNQSKSPQEQHEAFVLASTKHTNDKQNVHDSAINEQLRHCVNRLRETSFPLRDADRIKDEILTLINKEADETKRSRAMTSLNEIYKDSYDSTLNAREKEIIALVFARSEMTQNHERQSLLNDALFDSLVDMSPKSETETEKSVVCNHGRAARLLESLVMIDFDPEINQGANTLEQIRNDVLASSHNILQETIAEASVNDTDPLMKAVALSFNDLSITADPATEIVFKQTVKDKVKMQLDLDHKAKLSKRDYAKLLEQSFLAIDSL